MKEIIRCEVCYKRIKDDEMVFHRCGTTCCENCVKDIRVTQDTISKLKQEILELETSIEQLRIVEFNANCVIELLENKQKLNDTELKILNILKGKE